MFNGSSSHPTSWAAHPRDVPVSLSFFARSVAVQLRPEDLLTLGARGAVGGTQGRETLCLLSRASTSCISSSLCKLCGIPLIVYWFVLQEYSLRRRRGKKASLLDEPPLSRTLTRYSDDMCCQTLFWLNKATIANQTKLANKHFRNDAAQKRCNIPTTCLLNNNVIGRN